MSTLKNIAKYIFSKCGLVIVSSEYLKSFIHREDAYSYGGLLLINKLLGADEKLMILDIGANQGQTAKKLIKLFPLSEIHCFEPVTETFIILSNNLKKINNFRLYNAALGSEQTEKIIYFQKNSEWNSLSSNINFSSVKDQKSEIIKVNTVDNFVSSNDIHKINLLKTDTEGYELEVLTGAKQSLKNEVIDIIYVEVGFSIDDNQHNLWKDVIEFLSSFKYSFIGLYEMSFTEGKKMHYSNAIFASRLFLNANKVF